MARSARYTRDRCPCGHPIGDHDATGRGLACLGCGRCHFGDRLRVGKMDTHSYVQCECKLSRSDVADGR